MPILRVIMSIAEATVRLVGRVAQGAGEIIKWLFKLNDATDGWAGYILMAAAAWRFLNLSFLASPLGRLLALATIVALLIDDFLTFREGGESLIDWGSTFGTTLQVLAGIVGAVSAAFVVARMATTAWTAAQAALNSVMAAARIAVLAFNLVVYANPIGLMIAGVVALIAAGALLIANWDVVKKWFAGLFDWFAQKFGGLAEWAGKIAGVVSGGMLGGPALKPSPQAQAAIAGGSQNVSQQTQIIVQGGANPDATAKAVAGQQGRVNADMARNMRGAAA